MDDIVISNKQMKPAVVHTDQFANGVNVLTFVLDNCLQGDVDLRDYKAYAVTTLNGVEDITEIPYDVNGLSLKLTWSLSAYTLRNPGVIQYQIRFSESAEDATGVWWSYKGVIINRVSINADDPTSANYPTLLKQNQDLIQTLSGAFGSEIVYMPVGEPIPVEKRLLGRMYYQWLDVPSTRAKCATGTVNLGKHPYADSGLYINNVHIYVDNTSSAAFVIEPELWIEAINNADCGVTATDISTQDEVLLLLTAKDAGAAGNDIPIKLDVASYGAARGQSNPSGGHVSASKLVGGSDAVEGAVSPTGRFEDADGNILGDTSGQFGGVDANLSSLQNQLNSISKKSDVPFMPNYANRVTLAVGTTVVPVDAVGFVKKVVADQSSLEVKVNGATVFSCYSGSSTNASSSQFLIPAGSTVVITGSLGEGYYAPLVRNR